MNRHNMLGLALLMCSAAFMAYTLAHAVLP